MGVSVVNLLAHMVQSQRDGKCSRCGEAFASTREAPHRLSDGEEMGVDLIAEPCGHVTYSKGIRDAARAKGLIR